MKTKKSKSEWTTVQISKAFIEAAMRKAEKDSGMPEGSIKARGLVNALLAKYAAGNLIEVNPTKFISEHPVYIEVKK
jgi:hypothetical protein